MLLILGEIQTVASQLYQLSEEKHQFFTWLSEIDALIKEFLEEINRKKLLTHISDINLTYSSIARNYLLDEGWPKDQIIKTGSPMNEVLEYHQNQIQDSNIISES